MSNENTWLKTGVDDLVGHIEYILFRFAPLSAALLSAIAVSRALKDYLALGWIVVAVIVIEIVGLTSGLMIQQVDTFNRSREKDKRINAWAGYATFTLYALVVVGIILAGETIPTIASEVATIGQKVRSFVPLVFPFLTITGAIVIAIREHIKRVETTETSEQKARAEEARGAREEETKREESARKRADERADEERARLIRIEDEETARRHAREDADHALALEQKRLKMQARANDVPRAKVIKLSTAEDDISVALRAAMARGDTINQTEWAEKYEVNRGSIARRIEKIRSANGFHKQGEIQ